MLFSTWFSFRQSCEEQGVGLEDPYQDPYQPLPT